MPEPNEMALAMELLYEHHDFDKRTYLSFRYSGFSLVESCVLSSVEPERVKEWLDEDEDFANACIALRGRGKEIRKAIHENLKDRNERLFLELDAQKLAKAVGMYTDDNGERVNVTKDELDYLKRARGFYGSNDKPIVQNVNIAQLIQERHAERPTDNRGDAGEDNPVGAEPSPAS